MKQHREKTYHQGKAEERPYGKRSKGRDKAGTPDRKIGAQQCVLNIPTGTGKPFFRPRTENDTDPRLFRWSTTAPRQPNHAVERLSQVESSQVVPQA